MGLFKELSDRLKLFKESDPKTNGFLDDFLRNKSYRKYNKFRRFFFYLNRPELRIRQLNEICSKRQLKTRIEETEKILKSSSDGNHWDTDDNLNYFSAFGATLLCITIAILAILFFFNLSSNFICWLSIIVYAIAFVCFSVYAIKPILYYYRNFSYSKYRYASHLGIIKSFSRKKNVVDTDISLNAITNDIISYYKNNEENINYIIKNKDNIFQSLRDKKEYAGITYWENMIVIFEEIKNILQNNNHSLCTVLIKHIEHIKHLPNEEKIRNLVNKNYNRDSKDRYPVFLNFSRNSHFYFYKNDDKGILYNSLLCIGFTLVSLISMILAILSPLYYYNYLSVKSDIKNKMVEIISKPEVERLFKSETQHYFYQLDSIADINNTVKVSATTQMIEYNSLGNEIYYDYYVNGEEFGYSTELAYNGNGKYNLRVKITEDDSYPDVGSSSGSYSFSKEELLNGVNLEFYTTVYEYVGNSHHGWAKFKTTFDLKLLHSSYKPQKPQKRDIENKIKLQIADTVDVPISDVLQKTKEKLF